MTPTPTTAGAPEGKRPPGSMIGRAAASVLETPLGALRPHLPSELVGGSIPYAPGLEDEGVWNAAAQSCGTERVHYCYTISEGRCWYLATPSSALASSPDSWCPLAAALPGNSEFWDRETVYVYEQEGSAGALRWEPETGRMQVFLGAARSILPRIQSMEANFVTINPESAKQVRWRNRALYQERLSRVVAKILTLSGIAVIFVSLFVWLGSYLVVNMVTPRLEKAKQVTTDATNQLMLDATVALQTNTAQHLSRIIELYNAIGGFGGVLVRYELLSGGKVEWEALIPSAVQPGQLQAEAVGVEDGRIRVKGTR